MPLTVPTTIFPTEERFVNVVRETVDGTIPASSGTTFPVVQFEPEDKPIWLPDEALRGQMAATYGMLQGPRIAETSVGGYVFGDMVGHVLYNTMGDYTQTAPLSATVATTNAALAPGALTIAVVSGGAAFTVGTFAQIEASGSNTEIVKIGSGSTATSIVVDPTTPVRLNHISGVVVTLVSLGTGTYAHSFSLLNSYQGNGIVSYGQPPTHTWTDRTGVPATGFARQYAFGCFSSVTLTGNSEKLLEWNGALTSYVGQIAATPPVASVSGVGPYPDFATTVGLNGTIGTAPIYDISEWSVTIARQVEPFFTNDGSQNPYTIGRGKLDVTGKLTFSPAIDETALLYMLNNTRPQLQILTTNGLAGNSLITLQLDIIFAAFDTSKIVGSRSLFGYEVSFKAVSTASTANSVTTTGWSGGSSPLKLTLNNAVPVY